MRDADPRCPNCGEPIGQTATYCMHCSADLTDEHAAADADGDGVWDGPSTDSSGAATAGAADERVAGEAERLLDPDGLVDDALTVAVGVAGGLFVGLVGSIVLAVTTQSGWGVLLGVLAWLGSTAYLVRRRTVQGAVAATGYAVAVVLLLVPLIAVSPLIEVEGGLAARGGTFLAMLVGVALPAGVAAAIGWIASRFVPEDARGSEG